MITCISVGFNDHKRMIDNFIADKVFLFQIRTSALFGGKT